MRKNAVPLVIIPALFLCLYPLVLSSNTISDISKGAVAGLFIGLTVIALITIKRTSKKR